MFFRTNKLTISLNNGPRRLHMTTVALGTPWMPAQPVAQDQLIAMATVCGSWRYL